eukprot:TRINITY_DN882_c0_g1_i1.p1 TRINITY_DN882_c0_g1~~TRINITY_DN882_c0_g1_i1.p1  ORF type:complete len:332 (-),score=-4.78 TRINITY_DN882_c0_g1_i1:417-1265(-)
MNRVLLLLFFFIGMTSSQCPRIICRSYDPSTKVCAQIQPGSQTYFFSACPAGSFCEWQTASQEATGVCNSAKEDGKSCSDYTECKNGYCVNGKCSPRPGKLGILASSNLDCAKGLYRSPITGTCARQNPAGYNCAGDTISFHGPCRGRLVCNDGYCWQPMVTNDGIFAKNPMVCKSLYINKTTSMCGPAPVLQGANERGVKPCNRQTVDYDCIYKIGDVKYTASQLGKSCICTLTSENGGSFCELGEGDDVYIHNVKKVRWMALQNQQRTVIQRRLSPFLHQ